jgi:beta-xylosidase
MAKNIFTYILVFLPLFSLAQERYVSKVWVADNGNGTYKNPILHADYSDPDAIRVGDDYYMTASSFDAVPGLPILHSRDLVNWAILTYALKRQPPYDHFSKTQHGNGVWAPSIRHHNKEFYIYYPDPDFGIYLIKAKNIAGPWTEPELVEAGKGLIDPCPLWDDDASPNAGGGRGKVYLVHAFAGSRAGIKSVIVIKKMNAEGTKTIDDGVLVYDGHEKDPTIEGPKLYKRNGYYYIFAPAGGVTNGWQLALRSKNIYGPYERKVVMDQGGSPVNGPHQGAWVTTQTGEDWFLHFQDKDAYGRVVHLQPMKWENDWPVIGVNATNGKGEPTLNYKKPNVGKIYPTTTPVESDEFNSATMGLQWQWQANPQQNWAYLTGTSLRIYAQKLPDSSNSPWDYPFVLMQKFPAEEFTATVKATFKPKNDFDVASLLVMGTDIAELGLQNTPEGIRVFSAKGFQVDKGNGERIEDFERLNGKEVEIYLRVTINAKAVCKFSYSLNDQDFRNIGKEFVAKPGRWIGSKIGLCCHRNAKTNDSGFVDIDWIRIEK